MFMLKPYRCFNFMLPFETYERLKRISQQKNDISIAEIIRRGIDLILKDEEYKCLKNDK